MIIKKTTYRALYVCTVILTLLIFFAEFSPKIEVSALEELGLGVMVVAFLVTAARLRNACVKGKEQRQKTVQNTLWAIFLFYIVYLIWILYFDGGYNRLGLKTDFHAYFALKTNFIPFVTIHRYLSNISNNAQTGSAILNLAGNLLAFMPMGFFFPLLFRPMRRPWVFIPLLLLILIMAEGLQLLLRVGSCDIDDVILNMLGALLIFGVMKLPMMRKRIERLNF